MRDLIYMESFLASAIAVGKGSHALEGVLERLEAAQADLRAIREAGAFALDSRPLVRFPANDAGAKRTSDHGLGPWNDPTSCTG